jgi:starch synthase
MSRKFARQARGFLEPILVGANTNVRILFAASECAPMVKTGGLGDVIGALPQALRGLGLDVRLLLPGYRDVLSALPENDVCGRIEPVADLPAALIKESRTADGHYYVVDCPELYVRPGGPYQDEHGGDWADNARRFGLLSLAAAALARSDSPISWQPDLLHVHDWQAALAAAYLAFASGAHAPVVVTVHNLAFQGTFDPEWVSRLGLPPEAWSMHGVEYYGRLSFLKAGIYYADAVTTVSASYAREIQTPALGMGLEGLLAARAERLHGIVNGIDDAVWNPRTDRHIASRYSAASLWRKGANKRALRERLNLEMRDDAPVIGIVSRLTPQKGIDLVAEAAPLIVGQPAQLAVLGSGEHDFETALSALAKRYPRQIGVVLGFDEALAHLIEAGADAFLMPSRFEPCGMNQMYSQRYGTVPIVHATGGLIDTVVDCRPETLADSTATGFAFTEASAEAVRTHVERCVNAWRDPGTWRRLQRNGMARDFSWSASARAYAELYAALANFTTPRP